MPGQVFCRIFRGAERDDTDAQQQFARRKSALRNPFVRALPDLRSRVAAERRIDREIPLQFQMAPVIERISDGIRQRFGIGEKFLIFRRVARDHPLRHAVCAHHPDGALRA